MACARGARVPLAKSSQRPHPLQWELQAVSGPSRQESHFPGEKEDAQGARGALGTRRAGPLRCWPAPSLAVWFRFTFEQNHQQTDPPPTCSMRLPEELAMSLASL